EDRGLLDHRARAHLADDRLHQVRGLGGEIDDAAEIGARALLAASKLQYRTFEAGGDQVVLELSVVLEVALRLALDRTVERRLGVAVAGLLGGPAGAVTLHDEDLAERRIALLAVGELAGQRGDVERALAPGEVPRLARSFPGGGGLDHLADDPLGIRRMLFQP